MGDQKNTPWADVDRTIQKYRADVIKNLIKCDKEFWDTITTLKITAYRHTEEKNTYLKVIYVHTTDNYNLNDYCYHEESETDEVPIISKESRLEFGYMNGKFYINGKTPIRVYSKRDNPKLPIAYNNTYEHEIDESTQSILLSEYADNKNIPEWFLVLFFKMLYSGKKIDTLISELSFE